MYDLVSERMLNVLTIKPSMLATIKIIKNCYIKDYKKKFATGERFIKKVFIGYWKGKKYFSIGRGSKYFNQYPPKDRSGIMNKKGDGING
jgi:hypothetical protein